jgi:hypothetical protein
MTDKTTQSDDAAPEALLENTNRSIFLKALVFSTVGHLVFAGVTSFSLYAGWAKHGMFDERYGLLSRSEMRLIEKDNARQAEKEAREAELAAELEEQRKEAKLEMEQEGTAESTPEPEATQAAPTPPEIEPLPPKEGFSLDDLPDL